MMTIEQLRREIEKLHPSPMEVIAKFPDGSQRALTLKQYLENDDADFISIHGANIRAVKLVLAKYGGSSVID